MMNLTPTEAERLTIFTAAELARKRRAKGLRLSYIEAIAYITDELLEGAREGRSVAELVEWGATLLTTDDVLPGVAALVPRIMVDGLFEDGTRLIAVYNPIRPGRMPAGEERRPGEVITPDGEIELNEGRPRVTIEVVNTGDRAIQVASHFHFFEANRALAFDRALAFGMRLDVPAGGSVRFEPGMKREVALVALGGTGMVTGLNNLTNGSVRAAAVKEAALQRARELAFGAREEGPAMARMTRAAYAATYGPTTGDLVRLGDTSLLAEVEHDHAVYGDECMTGAGKVMRDGMGFDTRATAASGALDMLVQNATIIDPVLGIVKGDIGIRAGAIVAVGKAGNPAIQSGVHPALRCGPATTIVHADRLIATPGGVEAHAHFLCPQQCEHALAGGLTTIVGGTMGPHFDVSCAGPANLATMLRAAEQYPLNFGFLGRGSAHDVAAIVESVAAGAIGVKVHEDFGAMPATIDCALTAADRHDFQVQLHTDTINEAGYCEDTLAAIAGRTIHMYHVEGAGGGHAPDIIRVAGVAHCLPSSTNPTNPYTRNALDEGLPMTMDAHFLNWQLPEDVAFAESRVRPQTMAAEDILHDLGAISIFAADTQGMGRVTETVTNCWRLASTMKDRRGRLPGERTARADNERIKRYIAKYTINAARALGIDPYVGSLEPGKMADLVLWVPAFFGVKPLMVIKSGFVVWSAMGDASGCIFPTEPVVQRPMWGAVGDAPSVLSVFFASSLALEADVPRKLGLRRRMLPIRNTRSLGKRDMLHNDACPEIRVDSSTHEVYADGELLACEPASVVPLGRRYLLR